MTGRGSCPGDRVTKEMNNICTYRPSKEADTFKTLDLQHAFAIISDSTSPPVQFDQTAVVGVVGLVLSRRLRNPTGHESRPPLQAASIT